MPKRYNSIGTNRVSQAMSASPPVKEEPVAPPIIKNGHNHVNITGNPTSMDEVYNVPDNAPEHVKTGIKKGVDGKPNRYQCRYRCTKCEKTGKHFIPEGVETVDCHHCQASLQVKKATPGTQGIQPDKFKNWFVAGKQLPVSEFVYSHSHALK